MLIDIIKNAIKQIKIILSSKFYWYCTIISLIIMVWLLLAYLPFDTTYRLLSFTVGPIFVYALFFGVSVVCLYLSEGLKKIYDKTRLYTIQEYFGRTLGFVFIIIFLLFPFLPLAILVCSTGSLTFVQLFHLLPLLILNGIGFAWLGLFLKASFKSDNRQYASLVVQILWVIVLISSYLRSNHSLYIHPFLIYFLFILSASLFITLLYRSYRHSKVTGVDSRGK
ncbi:MAG: hypothetical protein ACLFPF_02855 [Halanaerobiales bacterium]